MPGPSLKIVPFSRNQVDDLLPMWRESFEYGVGITDPHPLEEQREYFFSEVLPNNDIKVALSAGEIVGFVAANWESISQLYVRCGWYRRGIGSKLLDWAKYQSDGSLWLYTFETNLVAQRFYEKNGFEIVARGFEEQWKLPDIKYRWNQVAN